MPCKYTPKTNQPCLVTEDKLKKATQMITEEKSSIRHAAKTYEVDRLTLKRYLDKQKLGYKIESSFYYSGREASSLITSEL